MWKFVRREGVDTRAVLFRIGASLVAGICLGAGLRQELPWNVLLIFASVLILLYFIVVPVVREYRAFKEEHAQFEDDLRALLDDLPREH